MYVVEISRPASGYGGRWWATSNSGSPSQVVAALRELADRVAAGTEVVSAMFVTPYPPGFPILVPGQVVTSDILAFMSALDVREIHGYLPEFGYRVFTESAMLNRRDEGRTKA